MHDGDLTEAILDRLLEWGVHFALNLPTARRSLGAIRQAQAPSFH